MNEIGEAVQKEVSKNDAILDLGCGIMQEFLTKSTRRNLIKRYYQNRKLKCKSILCVDSFENYLNKLKDQYPTIRQDIRITDNFMDSSFDIVICIDVLEHLDLNEAIKVMTEMIRISRKKAIIYTPSNFESNETATRNVWELGDNPLQMHKCVLKPETIASLGFKISHPEPDKNIFGVFNH